MRSVVDAVALVILFVVIVWGASIWASPQDTKPVMACKPVHLAVTLIGNAEAAITDRSSSTYPWQDKVRLWCLEIVDHQFSKKDETQ